MVVSKQIVVTILIGLAGACGAKAPSTISSDVSARKSGDSKILESAILQDIRLALAEDTKVEVDALCVPKTLDDVAKAIHDFSPEAETKGMLAWKFLVGMANSETFLQEFWHKRPLLIRAAETGGWVEGAFTVDKDLRLVDKSYITGFKTAEILRNGTKTDTWALSPLKNNPTQKTTWSDVSDALEGGTIYFNTAGSLWSNLGGLCRLTSFAFGLPPNVNVYCTPPGLTLSVPPHTDKQDVIVFQTQGSKRWRVFAPPPRSKGKDPLGRGKAGDVLTFEELGLPLIDTILQTGDVLYVPTGFPHTTDTSTIVDGADESVFEEHSVHLTMGLDTHVWCLSLAHMRWTLLQRCKKGVDLNIKDDTAYWNAMDSIPLGFLGRGTWKAAVRSMAQGKGVGVEYKQEVASKLKKVLTELEASRWEGAEGAGSDAEALPTDEEINAVTDYMVETHWRSLMDAHEKLFIDVDPKSEECIIKAFHGTQTQNLIMEKFGEFSHNKAFANSYAQRRLSAEQRTKGLI